MSPPQLASSAWCGLKHIVRLSEAQRQLPSWGSSPTIAHSPQGAGPSQSSSSRAGTMSSRSARWDKPVQPMSRSVAVRHLPIVWSQTAMPPHSASVLQGPRIFENSTNCATLGHWAASSHAGHASVGGSPTALLSVMSASVAFVDPELSTSQTHGSVTRAPIAASNM